MRTLSLDLETFSPTPLASSGVYRYAEDELMSRIRAGPLIDVVEPTIEDGPPIVVVTIT